MHALLAIFLLSFVVVAFGTRYVLLPITLQKSHWISAKPDRDLFNPAEQPLPAPVQEFFSSVENDLRTRGFESLGDSALTNFAERTAGNFRHFVNRANRDMGMVGAVYGKGKEGTWQVSVRSITFRTDFVDGLVLGTSNRTPMLSRPTRPNVRGYRFVDVHSASKLYEIHSAIVRHLFDGKLKDLPLDSKFNGDPSRLLDWYSSTELGHLVETGYYFLDEGTQKLRLTLKGAFLTAWKGQWPWKQLRLRWRDRTAARMLRQLESPHLLADDAPSRNERLSV